MALDMTNEECVAPKTDRQSQTRLKRTRQEPRSKLQYGGQPDTEEPKRTSLHTHVHNNKRAAIHTLSNIHTLSQHTRAGQGRSAGARQADAAPKGQGINRGRCVQQVRDARCQPAALLPGAGWPGLLSGSVFRGESGGC
eukprot:61204-Chlamydomonas_euryale.AAC.1